MICRRHCSNFSLPSAEPKRIRNKKKSTCYYTCAQIKSFHIHTSDLPLNITICELEGRICQDPSERLGKRISNCTVHNQNTSYYY